MAFRHTRRIAITALLAGACVAGAAHRPVAQDARGAAATLEASFVQTAQPFLNQNCMGCHRGEAAVAGLRVDQLNGALTEEQMETWERVQARIADGSMPPASSRQPLAAQRMAMTEWLDHAMLFARTRPVAKNGSVRRLTVAQYGNTLRALLRLDDNVADVLPPDAVSKEGFVNNQARLELSPSQAESYFEIADRALGRVLADPQKKPVIENFRLDFGTGVNRNPTGDRLIMGPGSNLLEPENFTVTQMTPKKPFAFTPFRMQTKFRFIEGYLGNATVRGWREFSGIEHAVFADFRGSNGYPKGEAWDSVPQGLLLRPAIPNVAPDGSDGFGPKANFKIAVRELPADGRFRITVMAAKYDDGQLLEPEARAKAENGKDAIIVAPGSNTVQVAKAGVYQVDLYPQAQAVANVTPDASRLSEGLAGEWKLDGPAAGWKLQGEATYVDTPFGKGVHFGSEVDGVVVPHAESLNVGTGDFTVSGWVKAGAGRMAALMSARGADGPGWALETGGGSIHFASYGADGKSNGKVRSEEGVLNNSWQHVAVTVGRGTGRTRIYVNGVLVGQGTTGSADISYKGELVIGGSAALESYLGDLDEFRLYRRALAPAEVMALARPDVVIPPAPQSRFARVVQPLVRLDIGARQFTGRQQTAFMAVRLKEGVTSIRAVMGAMDRPVRVVLTPLAATDPVAQRFAAFEKRAPKIGVHLGFRRDCGDTMVQVGAAQDVPGTNLRRYVFEGAMRNFPNPEVDPDENYISGVRQIGIRSEYTDSRDMPRLLIRSVEFEGPLLEQWPTASYRALMDSTASGDAAQARDILGRFATRAFRRPATQGERDAIYRIYAASAASGRNFRDSVKDALVATLTMPQFLFLVEKSATPGPEPLDGYELASKLSYFLWNGPPDPRLLQLAAAGTLRGQLNGEVTRMIADRRFNGFLNEFVPQWLALDKFQVLDPDRRQFPDLTRFMRANLVREPVETVRYLVANNLPARNLVTSDFVLVNEPVASYYGLEGVTNSGFGFVAVRPRRADLGGVMTAAAVQAGLSDGRESNPVKRGAWLARKIVAEPPPAPPPNVPPLPEDVKDLTLRQRIEMHRSAPACRTCHTRIDPWGVVFEQYDAGGRLKKDVVDASSVLPDGTKVRDVQGLKAYLADTRSDQVAFSVLKHLATYAAGRSLSYAELDSLKRDALRLKPGGYRMQDMIRYVVSSPSFVEK